MCNGQLKPAYNMQIAVNSEYITGIELFSDRNDVKTLQPLLKKLEQFHHARYEEVIADAECESLENYLYLDSTEQTCYIKPKTILSVRWVGFCIPKTPHMFHMLEALSLLKKTRMGHKTFVLRHILVRYQNQSRFWCSITVLRQTAESPLRIKSAYAAGSL